MATKLYTIESLLVGKNYYSRTLQGEIISAEIHPKAIWYGENTEAYVIEIRTGGLRNKFATIAVKTSDQIKSKQGQFRECSRPMS